MAKLGCQKSITLEPIDTKFDIVDYVCDTLQCVHVANYTDHLVEVSQQIYTYTVIYYFFNFYGINFCLPHETRPLNHCLHILILVRCQGSRPRGRPKRTWKEVVRKDCQARKRNKEDAMDCCKWRKVTRMGVSR